MKIPAWTFAALLLAAAHLHAASVEYAFALPEIEGGITLGVFDKSDKLVRTLCVNAAESDFKIGLNGLIGTWDGNDDSGKALPPAHYVIRGYVVGAGVKVEGEAFHFNDWIEDNDSPRFGRMADFSRSSTALYVVWEGEFQRRNGTFAQRYDLEGKAAWTTRVEAYRKSARAFSFRSTGIIRGIEVMTIPRPTSISPLIAASSRSASIVTDYGVSVIDADSGEVVSRKPSTGYFKAAAQNDSELAILSGERIGVFSLPSLDLLRQVPPPSKLSALALNADNWLGAGEDGAWTSDGKEWKKLSIEIPVSSISFGRDQSVWVVGREDERVFVGQFDGAGEFLREYRDDPPPKKVIASRDSDEITVLEENPSVQRLRILKMSLDEKGAPQWDIIFEKSIWKSTRFGLKDGKLVPDAGETQPPSDVTITINSGGLMTKAPRVQVRTGWRGGAMWLETREGLQLVRLPSGGSTLIAPPTQADSLTIYVGDGTVVEEYKLSGLNQIAPVFAGDVELR